MHGVLWVTDQFADGGHVQFEHLHAGLSRLANHPRCRLPAGEIRRRLTRYLQIGRMALCIVDLISNQVLRYLAKLVVGSSPFKTTGAGMDRGICNPVPADAETSKSGGQPRSRATI